MDISDSTRAVTSDDAECRRAPRIDTHLDILWKRDAFDVESGTISDISCTGCFILTGNPPPLAETISIYIPVKKEAAIYLRGEAVEVAAEIGFAVRFIINQTDEWKIEKLAGAYNFPLDKN